MGSPKNYSIELPARCLKLLDELWPHVQNCFPEEGNGLGPLTSTFLISMSMPIINVPIERLERRFGKKGDHYADDGPIDGDATKAFVRVLRDGELKDSPFFVAGAWSFATSAHVHNVALGLRDEIAIALASEEGKKNASTMTARKWHSILRNSLAHGGIAYLDKDGRSSHNTPVKMYAFVSGIFGNGLSQPPTGVDFLRISEKGYRDFLRLWVKWLREAGISKASEEAEV